jgi:hypothetical protein
MAIDTTGNLYIADQGNYRIRKVNTSGIITTIAGSTYGSSGNGGPATNATFKRPIGIAVDGAGNIYVGDQSTFTVRKISPSGIISHFAGTEGASGFAGDGGPATNAKFLAIYGLATDAAGNVYICDAQNNRIRKVSTSGIITTVAGNGYPGYGGDGGPAISCFLNNPAGVYIDGAGIMYIADSHNERIRRVDAAGIITTVAGTGAIGFSGDGGLSTYATMHDPTTVVADQNHNLYIADVMNVRVRKVTMVLSYNGSKVHNVEMCQNSSVSLDTMLTAQDMAVGLLDHWDSIRGPAHGTASVAFTAAANGSAITPSGLYYTPTPGFVGYDTIIVVVSNTIAFDTAVISIHVAPFINSAGTITGDSSVCVGSTILLSDSLAGGTWSISNLNAIVDDGLVTGESPGLDTISYTVVNSCGAASVSKVITVNPLPFVGTIKGPSELCAGATITLTDSIPGGYWTSANDHTAIDVHPPGCFVSGLSAGRDTIRYILADSLCTAVASHPVLVNPLPTAAISGGVPHLCIGSAVTLDGQPSGGVWTIANDHASTALLAGQLILTGMAQGQDTVFYTSSNSCGTAVDSFFFEVNNLPAKPLITKTDNILTAPPGYNYYQWTLNGLPVWQANADTFLMMEPGLYALRVKNEFGCQAVSDPVDFKGCGIDNIAVFPNPSASRIFISWCKKVTIRLLTMDGKQLKLLYNTSEIDLSGLPNANYMMVLFDESGVKIKVLIIAKLE